MSRMRGFTLIEVLIVVVVVAILVGIAIPSYQSSVQKTRRADAKEALLRIAAAQERFFFTNNRYGTLADLGLTTTTGYGAKIDSQESFYEIMMVDCGASTCFSIEATPVGAQLKDTKCSKFTLNHIGVKTPSTNDCW
jgi:type IV pilus assembly protein PilE